MNEIERLTQLFKAVGDENRLRILNLLHAQPCNAGDLAEQLDIKAPTVSHHLSQLREVGLLNLSARGNQRVYSLNTAMLQSMKQMVQRMDQLDLTLSPEDDKSWVEALPLNEADRRVIKDYTQNGQLKHLPVKAKKLMSVLRWILPAFEADRQYSEREVNEILKRYHEDYARLRREMVDADMLRRESNGRTYWRNPQLEPDSAAE